MVKSIGPVVFWLTMSTVAYVVAQANYLLFHSAAETIAIVVLMAVFFFSWNLRKDVNNNFFLIMGIGFLCVGVVDFIHMVSYKGLDIITSDPDVSVQLWVIGRYLKTLTFVLSLAVLKWKHRLNESVWLVGFGALTVLLLSTVFVWRVFPACYIDGVGLTPFKVASEYAVSFIAAIVTVVLWRQREAFDSAVVRLLLISSGAFIASEMAFTLYTDLYGFSNMFGHILKILSVYYLYRAIIEYGLLTPFRILLKDVADQESVRKEFFSVTVHELKNPVGHIGLSADMLKDHVTEESKLILGDIVAAKDRLTELIGGLLDISRVSSLAAVTAVEQVRMQPFINGILGLYAQDVSAKRLSVSFRCDPAAASVTLKRLLFEKIVSNLIGNAIRYSRTGGEVGITITRKLNGVALAIRDTGIGIPASEQSKVFNYYFRASNAKDVLGGTGLGLALVKGLLDAIGGTITFTSIENKGTTFTVVMPIAADIQ